MEDLEHITSSEEDRRWCVYIHRNKINNKAYIGIAVNAQKRWGIDGKNYLDKRQNGSFMHPVFANALLKYNNWEHDWEHIIFQKNLTQNEAKHIEILLIALFKTNCCRYRNPEYGYNMTDGGDGTSGLECTEETRNKIRESKKGKPLSEEHKEKLSELFSGENNPMYGKSGTLAPSFGRKDTEEQRKQKSDRMKGNTNMLGKNHSQDTKRKIGLANSNPSDEKRKKMSNAQKGKIVSDESKRKNSEAHQEICMLGNNPNAKPVDQYDKIGKFIKHYDCAQSAYLETGISADGINACCRGEQKTAGGFIWKR